MSDTMSNTPKAPDTAEVSVCNVANTIGNDHIRYPKLFELAKGCDIGAVNPLAIVTSLCEAMQEDKPSRAMVNEHLFIKIIVGQLSYLLGESIGPTEETIKAFKGFLNAVKYKPHDWTIAQYLSAVRIDERNQVTFGNWQQYGEYIGKRFLSGMFVGIEKDGYAHS